MEATVSLGQGVDVYLCFQMRRDQEEHFNWEILQSHYVNICGPRSRWGMSKHLVF